MLSLTLPCAQVAHPQLRLKQQQLTSKHYNGTSEKEKKFGLVFVAVLYM
jgi:hypothetical protein